MASSCRLVEAFCCWGSRRSADGEVDDAQVSRRLPLALPRLASQRGHRLRPAIGRSGGLAAPTLRDALILRALASITEAGICDLTFETEKKKRNEGERGGVARRAVDHEDG